MGILKTKYSFLSKRHGLVITLVLFIFLLSFQNCAQSSYDVDPRLQETQVAVQSSSTASGGDSEGKQPETPTQTPAPALTPTPTPTPTPNPTPEIVTCPSGQHLENKICIANTRNCNITNGFGTQSWNGSSWSTCTPTNCFNNYHLEMGSCQEDVRKCVTSAGLQGTQGFANNTWSPCMACQNGYTSFGGVCYQNDWINREFASYLPKCWNNGFITCASQSVNAFIGLPNVATATTSTAITFKIKYNWAANITLSPNHIQLLGTATNGCSVSVTGTGVEERFVRIQGCSGIGNLKFTIKAGSASDKFNQVLGEIGPSTDVMISNYAGLSATGHSKITKYYTGQNGNSLKYEMSIPNNYTSRSNIPIMIWIHGGAWLAGDLEEPSTQATARTFAELGFIVINTNYSLVQGLNLSSYPTPITATTTYAGVADINKLVNTLLADSELSTIYRGDKTKMSIAGASAGGHLAVMQATNPNNVHSFKCVIDVAGVTNLYTIKTSTTYPASAWIVGAIFGNLPTALNQNSPTQNISTFKGSKLAIFHQNQDNLVPIDQALQLAYKFKTQFPSKDLVLNYADDPIAPQPLYSPSMTQITHVYSSIEQVNDLIKSYAYSSCAQ